MVRLLEAPLASEKPQTTQSKRYPETTTEPVTKPLAWRVSTAPQHTHQKYPLVGDGEIILAQAAGHLRHGLL